MTLTEFLLARISEDEAASADWRAKGERLRATRLCAEAQAKRRIMERHQPTEVWTEATIDLTDGDAPDPDAIGRALAGGEKPWGWEDRTVKDDEGNVIVALDPVEARCTHDVRFAEWPCPDVLNLASVYSDHPDYDPAWSVG